MSEKDIRERIARSNMSDSDKHVLNGLLDDLLGPRFQMSEEEATPWILDRIQTREELAPELAEMERAIDAVFARNG